MKKVLLVVLFSLGFLSAQSFRKGNMIYNFNNDTIVISFTDSPSKYIYQVDSATHYHINKKDIYTFYVHQGKSNTAWTFEMDGMWSSQTPLIKDYGMYEPDFRIAMLFAQGDVRQWMDNSPPYDWHDTIDYRYPIHEIE